jgi:hypothetical protein
MSTNGMYLSAGAVLDDDTEIKVHDNPMIVLSGPGLGGMMSVQIMSGADAPAVADRLLAAVQEFHATVHLRARETDGSGA